MKRLLIILILQMLVLGCSALRQPREPDGSRSLDLPIPELAEVNRSDGLSRREAWELGRYYLDVIRPHSMLVDPADREHFWTIDLEAGYWGGVEVGRIWIHKNGTSMFLEAPRGGFEEYTIKSLKARNIPPQN